MTSRAPQTKLSAPTPGAKKLGAPLRLSREAAPVAREAAPSVKRSARNLLKTPQMTTREKASTERHASPGVAAHPGVASSSSSSPSPRKAAMSNKTAPAKDTTQEYREDSVEDTAVRRSPKGVTAESPSEDGPEETPTSQRMRVVLRPKRPPPA